MKLYFNPRSRALIARWMLDECGADYQIVPVDLVPAVRGAGPSAKGSACSRTTGWDAPSSPGSGHLRDPSRRRRRLDRPEGRVESEPSRSTV